MMDAEQIKQRTTQLADKMRSASGEAGSANKLSLWLDSTVFIDLFEEPRHKHSMPVNNAEQISHALGSAFASLNITDVIEDEVTRTSEAMKTFINATGIRRHDTVIGGIVAQKRAEENDVGGREEFEIISGDEVTIRTIVEGGDKWAALELFETRPENKKLSRDTGEYSVIELFESASLLEGGDNIIASKDRVFDKEEFSAYRSSTFYTSEIAAAALATGHLTPELYNDIAARCSTNFVREEWWYTPEEAQRMYATGEILEPDQSVLNIIDGMVSSLASRMRNSNSVDNTARAVVPSQGIAVNSFLEADDLPVLSPREAAEKLMRNGTDEAVAVVVDIGGKLTSIAFQMEILNARQQEMALLLTREGTGIIVENARGAIAGLGGSIRQYTAMPEGGDPRLSVTATILPREQHVDPMKVNDAVWGLGRDERMETAYVSCLIDGVQRNIRLTRGTLSSEADVVGIKGGIAEHTEPVAVQGAGVVEQQMAETERADASPTPAQQPEKQSPDTGQGTGQAKRQPPGQRR